MLFPKEIYKEKLLESKVWFSLIECKIIRKLLHTHPFFSCQSGRLGVHYVSRRGFGPALESRRLLHHNDFLLGMDGQECFHCRYHRNLQ